MLLCHINGKPHSKRLIYRRILWVVHTRDSTVRAIGHRNVLCKYLWMRMRYDSGWFAFLFSISKFHIHNTRVEVCILRDRTMYQSSQKNLHFAAYENAILQSFRCVYFRNLGTYDNPWNFVKSSEPYFYLLHWWYTTILIYFKRSYFMCGKGDGNLLQNHWDLLFSRD